MTSEGLSAKDVLEQVTSQTDLATVLIAGSCSFALGSAGYLVPGLDAGPAAIAGASLLLGIKKLAGSLRERMRRSRESDYGRHVEPDRAIRYFRQNGRFDLADKLAQDVAFHRLDLLTSRDLSDSVRATLENYRNEPENNSDARRILRRFTDDLRKIEAEASTRADNETLRQLRSWREQFDSEDADEDSIRVIMAEVQAVAWERERVQKEQAQSERESNERSDPNGLSPVPLTSPRKEGENLVKEG